MAGNLPKLSESEIQDHMAPLQGWQRDGDCIAKEFVLGGFSKAAQFIGRIAPVADEMDHHPDLQLYKYKRLKIFLTTHSAGGLTRNDFELAAKIDLLAATRKM